MSPTGSGTTSTDAEFPLRRARMVDRQLRRRGIRDQRVLAAMATVPRERFVPAQATDRAYRDGALAIGHGQTHLAALDRGADERAAGARGARAGARGGHGLGLRRRGPVAPLCAHVVTVERLPALSAEAGEALASAGIRNVELRIGDGSAGVPDRAPVRRDLRDRLRRRRRARRPRWSTSWPPGRALVCPLDRDGEEHLAVMRDGVIESVAPVRFVPLVEGGA